MSLGIIYLGTIILIEEKLINKYNVSDYMKINITNTNDVRNHNIITLLFSYFYLFGEWSALSASLR